MSEGDRVRVEEVAPEPANVRPAAGMPAARTTVMDVLALQRAAGNHAVASLLQRKPPETAAPPASPAPAAATDGAQRDPVLDREDAAITFLNGRPPAGKLWFVDPALVKVGLKEADTAELRCGPVKPRGTAPDERKGFDSAGAATAFAVVAGAGTGAAVLQQDGLFFVAPLTGATEFTRERARQVDLAAVRIVGADGFTYEPSRLYLANATLNAEKDMAAPASAAELAKLAGIQRPQDGPRPAGAPDQSVAIPDAAAETFLRQYLVARALELLNANRAYAKDQQKQFAATDPGSMARAPSGVSPEAKKKIDGAREITKKFSNLIDAEMKLEALERRVSRNQSIGSSHSLVEIDGKRLKVMTWKKRIADSKALLAQGKGKILAENPLLAQMIDVRVPEEDSFTSQFKDALRAGGLDGKAAAWAWDRLTDKDNPVGRSELAKDSSKENDETVRRQYVERLDTVIMAVDKVKAEVLIGDLRQLMGLPGLSHRVRGEMKGISGSNKALGDKLQKIVDDLGMSAADIAGKTVQIGGVVLQLAGFFFPPLEFVGAVLSFAGASYEMSKSLDRWGASQAAVTPDQALVDPVQAQNEMIDATISIAMEAINVGLSLEAGMKAIEEGGKGLKAPHDGGTPAPGDEAPGAGGAAAPAGIRDPAGTTPGMAATSTGLADSQAMSKFAAGMKGVQADWMALSPVQRVERVSFELNARLREAGIPSVHVRQSPPGTGRGAQFDFTTWSVVISGDAVTMSKFPGEIAEIVNSAYHEGRHAEQWYLMARMRAGLGEDAATIGAKMGIKDQFMLDQAAAHPLHPGSPEHFAAQKWWDSVYGRGAAARNALLHPTTGKLPLAAQARDAAYNAYEAVRTNKAVPYPDRLNKYNDWVNANAAWETAYKEYRALPEEVDAWGVGGAAEFGFLPRTPVPAPIGPPPAPVP